MFGKVSFWLICAGLLLIRNARAEDQVPASTWVPDQRSEATVLNRLIADPGYSIGDAYVDAFMTPELCGGASVETDAEFIEQLVRTFLRRSPTESEQVALTRILATGYPRRDLTEAVAFRPPLRPPAPEFVPLLASLRWEALVTTFREVIRWTTGEDLEIARRSPSLLLPLFALYEGADPRRSFADTLLVHAMNAFPEDDTAAFVRHTSAAVLGRTPSPIELERFAKLVPPIDRSRHLRTPLWVRFRFIERFFKSTELVPRRFLELMIARCRPPLSGVVESDLPMWARTHASTHEVIMQSLGEVPSPGTPPYLCTPFNTHLVTIGHVGSDALHLGGGCAPHHAFYALDRGARGNSEITSRAAEQVGVTGYCCRLPADDILEADDYRYELTRCPAGYVATGGRAAVNLDRCDSPTDSNCAPSQRLPNAFIRCTKINERRYQLGPSRSGRLWVEDPNSAAEHLSPILRSALPAGIRSAVGLRQPNDLMPNGCIGWPIGSLFVEKQGPYCEQHYFRALQYRGLPGDPSRGSPVEMFAACDDLDLSNLSQPKCVRTSEARQ